MPGTPRTATGAENVAWTADGVAQGVPPVGGPRYDPDVRCPRNEDPEDLGQPVERVLCCSRASKSIIFDRSAVETGTQQTSTDMKATHVRPARKRAHDDDFASPVLEAPCPYLSVCFRVSVLVPDVALVVPRVVVEVGIAVGDLVAVQPVDRHPCPCRRGVVAGVHRAGAGERAEPVPVGDDVGVSEICALYLIESNTDTELVSPSNHLQSHLSVKDSIGFVGTVREYRKLSTPAFDPESAVCREANQRNLAAANQPESYPMGQLPKMRTMVGIMHVGLLVPSLRERRSAVRRFHVGVLPPRVPGVGNGTSVTLVTVAPCPHMTRPRIARMGAMCPPLGEAGIGESVPSPAPFHSTRCPVDTPCS